MLLDRFVNALVLGLLTATGVTFLAFLPGPFGSVEKNGVDIIALMRAYLDPVVSTEGRPGERSSCSSTCPGMRALPA